MNQDIVITLLQKMFILTLEISVPSTLTFVPKIVGCVLLLIFLMPWMFSVFITTVNEFMDMIPQLIGGA